MPKLTVPKFTVKVNIKIRDKNKKVILDENIKIHSFVKNYYLKVLAAAAMCNSRDGDGLAALDINNTSRYSNSYICLLSDDEDDFVAANGDDTKGITVGSGNTAENFSSDYALDTKISSGSGSGELNYNLMTGPVISDVDDTRTASFSRTFSNNSGGSITVREIGWNTDGFIAGGSKVEYLFFRDVLDPTYTLTNGQELEVNVSINLQYPETIS